MAREGGKRGWPGSNSAPPSALLPELPGVRAPPSVRAGLPLRLSSLRTAARRPFRVQARAGAGAGRFSPHRRPIRALRGAVFSHAGRPLRVRQSLLRTQCGGLSAPRRRHGRAQAGFPDKRARALVSCRRPLAQVQPFPGGPVVRRECGRDGCASAFRCRCACSAGQGMLVRRGAWR